MWYAFNNNILQCLCYEDPTHISYTCIQYLVLSSSECVWWKAWVIIHTAISTMLALVWSIQLVRTIHAEKDSLSLQAGEDSLYTTSMNPLQYEEGR